MIGDGAGAAGSHDGARARGDALQRLVEGLASARTPAEIAAVTVGIAADLLGADAAALYVPEPRPDAHGIATLRALHSVGWPAPTARAFERIELRRGRPLSDAVLTGSPVWIHDATEWRERYPEMGAVGTSAGSQASACLPLHIDDRDLGAVVFSFGRPRAFDDDERAHLLAVAALCGQALDRERTRTAEQRARLAARRQLDQMTFLAQANRLMDAPLSVESRLQRLADLVVPDVADWCAVHLVRAGAVEQVAVAHSDPDKLSFVARLEERYPPDPRATSGAMRVARTGVPTFAADITEGMLADVAVDADHLELIRAIGLRSYMVVPLLVRGRSLGALTVVQAESDRRFTDEDLTFIGQLATTAAVALDNARLFEQQRHVAHTLQTALLPAELPDIPGLDLAARYHPQSSDPADFYVGGDIYDVVEVDGDAHGPRSWSAMVADVCGKGPEAAALTALIRYTWRSEVAHRLPPAQVLARINTAMRSRPRPDRYRFATMAHARITIGDTGVTATLANGGHEPALTLRGGLVETCAQSGTLLGVFPDVALCEREVHLRPGDALVLYTDGLTEARSGTDVYGPERLEARLASCAGRDADHIADALLTDALEFQAGLPRDDIAILVLRASPAAR